MRWISATTSFCLTIARPLLCSRVIKLLKASITKGGAAWTTPEARSFGETGLIDILFFFVVFENDRLIWNSCVVRRSRIWTPVVATFDTQRLDSSWVIAIDDLKNLHACLHVCRRVRYVLSWKQRRTEHVGRLSHYQNFCKKCQMTYSAPKVMPKLMAMINHYIMRNLTGNIF